MAGMETQFTLITQLETLLDINRYFDKYKSDNERHVKIRKIHLNPNHPIIPLDKLSFMMKGKDAEILHKIVKIEERFFSVIEGVKIRNTTHNDFQEEFPEATQKTLKTLENYTKQMYDNLEKTIASYKDTQQCLKEYLDKEFDRKSLSFVFIEVEYHKP